MCGSDRLPFHAVKPAVTKPGVRPDFVLGDRFSTSCSPKFTRLVGGASQGHGVCGGLQQALCRRVHHRALRSPVQEHRHALQIEVNRSLYMDEHRYKRSENFKTCTPDLEQLAETMIEMAPPCSTYLARRPNSLPVLIHHASGQEKRAARTCRAAQV